MDFLRRFFLLLVMTMLICVNAEAAESSAVTSPKPGPTSFNFQSEPFTEVVAVNGATAEELYYRAREWFSKNYVSANKVLQMDSKERLTLIGNGVIEVPAGSMFGPSKDAEGFVKYTISIYLKDGRYKYEVSAARHETTLPKIVSAGSLYKDHANGDSIWFGKLTDGAFNYIKEYSAASLGRTIDRLKEAMSQRGNAAKGNEW